MYVRAIPLMRGGQGFVKPRLRHISLTFNRNHCTFYFNSSRETHMYFDALFCTHTHALHVVLQFFVPSSHPPNIF